MFSKFLLAFDGTVDGREALREASALACRLGAKVHLLVVVRLSPGELIGEAGLPGAVADKREAAMRLILDAAAAELRACGITVDASLSRALDPAREIADVAREVGADLIVIGHRDRDLLERLWQGSVGRSLIGQAPCSILVAVMPEREYAGAAAG